MGRPLNPRYFGPPTAGGSEIKCDFYNGSAVTEGYIVKQLGSKKFRVAAIGTPGTTYDRFLTTGKLATALTGTEMAITVKGDDSETYQVSKISGRMATIVAPDGTGSNALDGSKIKWNFSTSTTDGGVQVEEAGDDDTLVGTDDDDFTNA
jgi:hypothetical protein